MKRFVLLIAIGIITACAHESLGTFIGDNRQKLMNLAPGMTKERVNSVMGQNKVRSYANPYRTALTQAPDGALMEVYYYWTDGTALDGIQDYELTPVVFNNGKVVGWGREFWSEYVQQGLIGGSRQQQQSLAAPQSRPSSSVVVPNSGSDALPGIPMYPASSCIGPVIMGECKGTILNPGPAPKRCYGTVLNGKCIGPEF